MLTIIDPTSINLEIHSIIFADNVPVIIDKEDFEKLSSYSWHIFQLKHYIYAFRHAFLHGSLQRVSMHRQIVDYPEKMVVHHKNRCGLDNRKDNLELLSKEAHHNLHNR